MWLEDLGGPFRGWIPRKALAPQLGAYDGKNLDVQIMDRYCIDRQGNEYLISRVNTWEDFNPTVMDTIKPTSEIIGDHN